MFYSETLVKISRRDVFKRASLALGGVTVVDNF